MYVLPQSRILENKLLKTQILEDGYYPCKFMLNIWKHDERTLNFFLTVNDFGIKYAGGNNAEHLIEVFQK